MNISIATVFEELYKPFFDTSLVRRAQERNLISLSTKNFFDATSPKKRIDAPTYGPGAGMLIKPTVVQKTIDSLEKERGTAHKIFFSPQGKKLTQPLLKDILNKAQKKGHLMLIPSRYEGMDARVEKQYADEVISVGDFVLLGGDLPAMMLIEGMIRLIPGVVGKQESVEKESFSGPFVDFPVYTEPVVWEGKEVPDIVRSGNHGAIEKWRTEKAAQKTVLSHFSWLKAYPVDSKEKKQAAAYIPSHYVALMHDQVVIGPERIEGTTSVTSIDLHDIARSSATYGVKQFCVVTPLLDQQAIVRKFLSFWQEGYGVTYNKNRHHAVNRVVVKESLDTVCVEIEKKEGKKPLIIATSARTVSGVSQITYYDQAEVWQHDRPVLILLGTGGGLTDALVQKSDYLLGPIHGFTDFNHLSVRSAAAIIFDRWLGINEQQ